MSLKATLADASSVVVSPQEHITRSEQAMLSREALGGGGGGGGGGEGGE